MTIEELYTLYKGHLFRLCRRYVRNAQDTEDVVSDVFMRAMNGLHSFRGESQYLTWLYRIAVNACLDFLKKHRHELIEFDETCFHDGHFSRFSPSLKRLIWDKMLNGFDKTERTILLLHVVEGVSLSETAEITGLSRQTVHKKWNTIKNALFIQYGGSI